MTFILYADDLLFLKHEITSRAFEYQVVAKVVFRRVFAHFVLCVLKRARDYVHFLRPFR